MTEDVPGRILDAVERLCVEASPSEVTMRRIAEKAGVSLGLAYHYFESKDALFGRALDRMAAYIAGGADPGDDPAAVLEELWNRLKARPAFVRMLAALLLEGKDVSAIMSGHPLLAGVAARAAAEGRPDPQAVAGTLAMLALAGALFGAGMNRALGRTPDDPALFEALARLLD